VNLFYVHVFGQLLAAEFVVWRYLIRDTLINLLIWTAVRVFIMGHLMAPYGLKTDYGLFHLASLVASAGLFDVYFQVILLVKNIETDHQIFYQLTLPVPSWVIILKTLTVYTLNSIFLTVCTIPLVKLIMWHSFDLTKIAILPTVAMILVSGIFYSTYILWLAAIVQRLSKIGWVWERFNFPMWLLGGFHFSWAALYALYPVLAYICLLNPFIFIMEGMRGAMLGQDGYINVWYCVLALCAFSSAFVWHAVRRLKRLLDYV